MKRGTDLVLRQQGGELALLQDDHVLLDRGDLRHQTLEHDLLESDKHQKSIRAADTWNRSFRNLLTVQL